MTNQVLFIQGGGEGVHDEWDSKLVGSLERELGAVYEIRYPRMPNEADPKYTLWKAVLKKEFVKLPAGAVLVGHSIGATILINVLAEESSSLSLSGIFLIAAPFVGQGGWSSEDIAPMSDLGARLQQSWWIYLYHGSDDDTAPFTHVDLYEKAIPQAVVRRLASRNHQLDEDMSEVAADIRRLLKVKAL
jgi:predicted alpha/beta hydrolase family esterase